MMKLKLWIALAALGLGACTTTFEPNKVDYKSQGRQAAALEIPPDLSVVSQSAQAIVPSSGTAAASSSAAAPSERLENTPAVGVNAVGDIKVMRDGSERWLVTPLPPEKIWGEIKQFWADNGLPIVVDEPKIGVMETDWVENRAKIPQDGIRKYLGKLFDNLYSTNERDKYRTRVERTPSGGSEIYISHRGMVEEFASKDKSRLVWVPRPSDPELEIEFLKRLMVRLGTTDATAKAALENPKAVKAPAAGEAALAATARASFEQTDKGISLLMTDAYDTAWRRIGQSLDRTNFTVEDRDRAKGIYFVRYVNAEAEKNQPGFFARLLGSKTKDSLQKYQIIVTAEGEKTRVHVADTDGKPLATSDAKNVLNVLLSDLK